jgi:hypothetical protein
LPGRSPSPFLRYPADRFLPLYWLSRRAASPLQYLSEMPLFVTRIGAHSAPFGPFIAILFKSAA